MFLGRDVGEVYAGGGQGVQSGLRFLLHNNIDVRILNIVKRVKTGPKDFTVSCFGTYFFMSFNNFSAPTFLPLPRSNFPPDIQSVRVDKMPFIYFSPRFFFHNINPPLENYSIIYTPVSNRKQF